MKVKRFYMVEFTENKLGQRDEYMNIVADGAREALIKAEEVTDREVRAVILGGEVYV